MAERPVFAVLGGPPYVKMIKTEFKYYSGFALSQAQKSVKSLHDSFADVHPIYRDKVLEISSKSAVATGILLSAFNLQYTCADGKPHSVEAVFQSGKCFSNGKQYTDILQMSAKDAKHDPRLKNSGDVVAFRLEGVEFPTQPQTFFYDWLYINALLQNAELASQLMRYRAFTDIAFNPAKSINCQARSAAVFVSLTGMGLIEKAMASPRAFMSILYPEKVVKKAEPVTETQQMMLEL